MRIGSILFSGVFCIVYGLAGLLGFQVIPEKYKGKGWTKKYIRFSGTSWLLLGIPWLILYLVLRGKELDALSVIILLVACGLPCLIYTFINERKYKAMLRE